MTEKTAVWFLYDQQNRVVASWRDAPAPRFRVSADGPDGVTVRLPWVPGVRQQAVRGVAWHRRADCYTATAESQAGAYGVDLYGSGLYGDGGTYGSFTSSGGGLVTATARSGLARGGDAAYGSAAGPGRLIYRGLVENWAELPDAGAFEVALTPLSRRADLVSLPAGALYTGDVAQIARSVTETHGRGLSWAALNPASAGVIVTVDLSRLSVRAALSRLRDYAGQGWVTAVTPQGLVRFFLPDPEAPDHRLIAGVTARDVRLEVLGEERRRRVVVLWSGGEAVAQAPDYDPDDPSEEQVAASEITDAGTAGRLAEAVLAQRDRLQTAGSCTVTAAYDVDTLAVGDLVALRVEYDNGDTGAVDVYGGGVYGDGGTYGSPAGSEALLIAGLDYDFHEARLELTRPAPRGSRALERLARELQTARALAV